MAILTVTKEINSAHGKQIHGHTFKIEFEFQGLIKNGMVENLDFHDIEPRINEVIKSLDKTYLDDVLKTRATIENISIYIIKKLNHPYLFSVTVWEGMNQKVKVFTSEVFNEK